MPDIYQGAELWNLSLVDPDNRQAVDFDTRRQFLDADASRDPGDLLADWRSGAIKLSIMLKALRLRAEHPALFTTGTYGPLSVYGPRAAQTIAFLRTDETRAAMTIAPIRARALLGGSTRPLVPPEAWEDTHITLDAARAGGSWRNVLTGQSVSAHDGRLHLADALGSFPVALLTAD